MRAKPCGMCDDRKGMDEEAREPSDQPKTDRERRLLCFDYTRVMWSLLLEVYTQFPMFVMCARGG